MAKTPSDQRITKAERKEQARREREELQRKMASSRRNRRIGVGIALVAVIGVIAFFLTRPEPVSADPQKLLDGATQAAKDAGCDDPTDVGPYQPEDQDRAHVPPEQAPPLSTYPSTPPASGPHNEIALPSGVYDTPPPIDRVIHSLEHGAAVVWYAPNAPAADVEELGTFYAAADVGDRVIVAPYDYPDQGAAGSLPSGIQMSLVSWHTLQQCAQVNTSAAFGFTSSWAAPPFGDRPYLGSAPEAGAAF
jgi:Protein of unknown function (DUF3105)